MRVAIIGNSGSGKSTLARELAQGRPLLDLDTIAWAPGPLPQPRERALAIADLERFCAGDSWIVEGCYGYLIAHALRWQPELVWLDPGVEVCLAHCRARPWEPHKYASKAEQDEKLEFLLEWVADYYVRDGDMSAQRHREIFEDYAGPKRRA